MKKTLRVLATYFLLFFALAFPFQYAMLMIWLLLQAGMSKLASFVMEASFYLANWPSILTRIFPVSVRSDGVIGYDIIHWIRNPKVILTNAIGWGLVGFIVGLIISAVKERKQRRILTNKNELNSQ